MRISDWSSDVCSSDLCADDAEAKAGGGSRLPDRREGSGGGQGGGSGQELATMHWSLPRGVVRSASCTAFMTRQGRNDADFDRKDNGGRRLRRGSHSCWSCCGPRYWGPGTGRAT